MGNETSGLGDLTFGEEYAIDGEQAGTVHTASKKDGGKVSVFTYKKDKRFSQYVDNTVKHLKILRHPGILKFLHMKSTADANLLMTEHVRPLMAVIDTMTPGEICAGIFNVLEALTFLHEKGGLCHNNVCLASIFVNDEGSWLIGGLEFVARFQEATNAYLKKCRTLRNQAAIAPEEKAGCTEATSLGGVARDAYGFGVLADQLQEYIVELGDLTKTFELRIQDECLNPDPMERPKLIEILQDKMFKTDFVDISNFLKQVTLKSEDEKKEFFSGLVYRLYSLPVDLIAVRLVRPLLARFVLLDPTADEFLIPHLLTPYSGNTRPTFEKESISPILPVSLFCKHVVPELYKIFHVRDAHIRKVLLKYFPCYVQQFDQDTLSTAILPQIVLGLRDSDDELVGSSLHCLGDMVSLIGADQVIGQNRTRIFSCGVPKFSAVNGTTSSAKPPLHPKPSDRDKVQRQEETTEKRPESGKKTLKDIAKEADRQKRKEEARRKAKERLEKREVEKKKPAPKLAEKIASPVKRVPELDVADNKVDSSKMDLSQPSINTDQSESPTQSDHDNWEGWGAEDNPSESIDSDIDREIEHELIAMDAASKSQILHPDDSSSRSSAADVHIDWSDTALPASKAPKSPPKGMLKLSSAKTRTSPPPQRALDSSSQAEFDVKSPNRKHVQNENTTAKETGKNEEASGKKSIRKKSSDALGAEFDIKAIDIKKTSSGGDEMDFFADMAPVIKTSNILDIIIGGADKGGDTGGDAEGNDHKPTASLSYAAQEEAETAEGGWGDDFGDDWGDA